MFSYCNRRFVSLVAAVKYVCGFRVVCGVLCCFVWVLVPFYLLNIMMRSPPAFSRLCSDSGIVIVRGFMLILAGVQEEQL